MISTGLSVLFREWRNYSLDPGGVEFYGLVHFGSVPQMGHLNQRDTLISFSKCFSQVLLANWDSPSLLLWATRIYFKFTVYKVDESTNFFFLGKGDKRQDELLFNTDVSQYLILWFFCKWRVTISHPSKARCGHVTSFWPMGCEWEWQVSLPGWSI